jgi:riboflavin kinase/FMN adenylyltransferase
MQQYTSLEELNLNGSWLSIGTFDGVHLGHQAIIKELVNGANRDGLPSVVLTFFPHPAIVLNKRNQSNLLTSPDERAYLLGKLGVDFVITYPFTSAIAQLTSEDFILQLHKWLKFRWLVVGYDFALGKGREGNVPRLVELGNQYHFSVEAIPAVKSMERVISSSEIRSDILEGKMVEVKKLLGRNYSISGEVVPGDGRGKLLNIPTANLAVWPEKAIPKVGVYACLAHYGDNIWRAVTNIGVRPTFLESSKLIRVETHILGFNGDLYGKMLELEFVNRIRDEIRFENSENLISQIQKDIATTEKVLARM